MTLGVNPRAAVLLSGLVRLLFSAVGQAQAAPLLVQTPYELMLNV